MKLEQLTCTVSASDDAVDAGATFTLQVRAEPVAGEGALVSIRDAAGKERARAALVRAEGNASESGDISLTAPAGAGEHIYRAVVLAPGGKRALHEVASSEVRVEVKAHAAYLNIWDVPSAIPAGERFSFKVGLACSAACNLAGHRVRILDNDGRAVAAVALAPEPWPGTDALYVAEAQGVAPAEVGRHSWRIETTEWDAELPHAAGTADLSVNTVPAPDCTVTITVTEYEMPKPIGGATVVAHPFRTTTDAAGVAIFKVPKGRYDVMISAARYAPYSIPIEADADVTATAELEPDETWKTDDEQFG